MLLESCFLITHILLNCAYILPNSMDPESSHFTLIQKSYMLVSEGRRKDEARVLLMRNVTPS